MWFGSLQALKPADKFLADRAAASANPPPPVTEEEGTTKYLLSIPKLLFLPLVSFLFSFLKRKFLVFDSSMDLV